MSIGRTAKGRIKKGFKITKGGRVVKASGRSRSTTGKSGGKRRRRKSGGKFLGLF